LEEGALPSLVTRQESGPAGLEIQRPTAAQR
jgi:hypothetical protein